MTTIPDSSRFETAPAGQSFRVAKVDSRRGIVVGYGAVCTEKGEPYFDLHDEHLPEDEMLDATLAFVESARDAKVMHEGGPVGKVVCAFPLTTDIAKALDIITERTGVLIVWKPDDRDLLTKFASGEWTGFSFGGWASKEDVP